MTKQYRTCLIFLLEKEWRLAVFFVEKDLGSLHVFCAWWLHFPISSLSSKEFHFSYLLVTDLTAAQRVRGTDTGLPRDGLRSMWLTTHGLNIGFSSNDSLFCFKRKTLHFTCIIVPLSPSFLLLWKRIHSWCQGSLGMWRRSGSQRWRHRAEQSHLLPAGQARPLDSQPNPVILEIKTPA